LAGTSGIDYYPLNKNLFALHIVNPAVKLIFILVDLAQPGYIGLPGHRSRTKLFFGNRQSLFTFKSVPLIIFFEQNKRISLTISYPGFKMKI
jgi:hypothetical protein